MHNELDAQDRKELNHVHAMVDESISLLERIHNKKRVDMIVTCCMSGGVDSSVATLLLKEAGVQVRALFMNNWDASGEESIDPQKICENVRLDWKDVRSVCEKFKIPHFHETLSPDCNESTNARPVKFIEIYWNQVFQRMLKDYENGLTPSPDLLCNKYVKFNALFKYLEQKSSDPSQINLIATGHYAQLAMDQNEKLFLLQGKDKTKDQTYFLAQVDPRVFKQCIFPLGGLIKKQHVRELLAKKYYKLSERIYTKKESMGLCFVGKRKKFTDFLADYIDERPGPIISMTDDISEIRLQKASERKLLKNKWQSILNEKDADRIIGEHRGAAFYTIGQSVPVSGLKQKVYICKRDVKNNIVYVAPASIASEWINGIAFNTYNPHWLVENPVEMYKDNTTVYTKIRHADMVPKACILNYHSSLEYLEVISTGEPFNGIAPGQPAVFYKKLDVFDEMVCMGSAIIENKR